MGIVLKQSFLNTVILFLGFAIGGVNVMFLYTHFLHEDYFGLITFLLSTANILLPLLVFGMHHTVVKYFSSYTSKQEQDTFLMSSVLLPLLIIIPAAFLGMFFYETIANLISTKNILIKNYTWLIFFVAIFMGYFEVFYAWTKVRFKSVFGGFIKEVFARLCTSILLFAVYFNWINSEQFIYGVVIVYALRVIIMKLYAFYIYMPTISFKLPSNVKELVSFSLYIIIAGSAASVLLEIDKFMIPQVEKIAEVAYYSVGIYIASVVAIPTRAMQQITSPITAKDMNENNIVEVEKLYKQTSINLLVIGGLFFLLINLNISDLYEIINKPQFTKGIWIVLIISVAKLMELAMGTANSILVNSKYYKIFFYLSLAMALTVILLNHWLIKAVGINGAALATLIVVVVYGFIKIVYINYKFKISPFKPETVKLLLILTVVFFSFYFLNINLNPFFTIIIKSILISVIYLFLVKSLNISKDLNELFFNFIKNKKS
ncbi:Membrane protein involved in the export of O-antigen and teichoic acid [Lutibacter oricola]|uniref:Membrane protein involved in the export of O-antigen and teichoic acid n=1 Tax=Lutibacter oricola TaxID=762486 RepID=A0A1H3CBA8_9FLAO|nr:oligosaccharide flippase family protein [Lutibacter oricola]SDX51472.1 Membrane protein involved in the export of O-antigen and teichoic acid [Lutibacter oricola]